VGGWNSFAPVQPIVLYPAQVFKIAKKISSIIQNAIQFFNSCKLSLWWTVAEGLETKGFQFGGIFTGIALDISKAIFN
jgi:hypothetical protein